MRYAAAVLLVAAGLAAVPPPATAAPTPRCEGRPATLVGAPNQPVRGTPGDDVVVSNGSGSVSTFGGDDVVCLTGRPPTGRHQVGTGRGDDVVVNQTDLPAQVRLGSGGDRFQGGPAAESVRVRGVARGADRIDTRGGDDDVDAAIYTRPSGYLRGGPGDDDIYLYLIDRESAPLRIDNRTGRTQVGRGPTIVLAGFESFAFPSVGRVSFLGRDVDEHLNVADVGSIDLRGGDDSISLPAEVDVRGPVIGGAGSDQISMYALGARPYVTRIDLDLETGRLVRYSRGDYPPIVLRRFNGAALLVDEVHLTGTDGPDELRFEACTGSVDAGGGDDTVQAAGRFFRPEGEPPCPASERVPVHGGDGDDVLLGSEFSDLLIGDAGDDTADGGEDVDQCDAETTTACELPAQRSIRRTVRS